MNTVFVGGSRHVSRLPAPALERLGNVVSSGFPVVVGDANGADKAVQKFLAEKSYGTVTVFCTGETCRNNLGHWQTKHVAAPRSAKGFEFYAVKDREMAKSADFGLMIWDGKSIGTLLNVLRLVLDGKKTVLINNASRAMTTLKSLEDWKTFFAACTEEVRSELRLKATPKEWQAANTLQPDLLSHTAGPASSDVKPPPNETETLTQDLNAALATGDSKQVVDALGHIAKARGMSQVAKSTGLAREALYRALSAEGNPEFTTVMKVMDALGFRLAAHRER